jgi:hypothetical protein
MTEAQQWPATRVEMWALDKIVPYERNPRSHSQEQINLLAKGMTEDGVTMPILVDEKGIIIAGHGRLAAAKVNGYKEYPVVIARDWPEARKKAARIRDNQLSLLSRWDDRLLRMEVGEIKMEGGDLKLLGFDDAQLFAFTLEQEQGATNIELEWAGMPEFSLGDQRAFRSIIMHFKDQAALDKFSSTLKIEISEKARYLWYPEIVIEPARDKRYKAES